MRKKSQSILEYAILFALVIAALIVMQVYVKRSYQGRLKREADSLGQQYSPGHAASFSKTTVVSNSVTYTGTQTSSSDMPGVIAGSSELDPGVTVTVSKGNNTVHSVEATDTLGSEKLYTK